MDNNIINNTINVIIHSKTLRRRTKYTGTGTELTKSVDQKEYLALERDVRIQRQRIEELELSQIAATARLHANTLSIYGLQEQKIRQEQKIDYLNYIVKSIHPYINSRTVLSNEIEVFKKQKVDNDFKLDFNVHLALNEHIQKPKQKSNEIQPEEILDEIVNLLEGQIKELKSELHIQKHISDHLNVKFQLKKNQRKIVKKRGIDEISLAESRIITNDLIKTIHQLNYTHNVLYALERKVKRQVQELQYGRGDVRVLKEAEQRMLEGEFEQ
ncbi:Hypothetical_protein [Hexamita inflata]|uniref:Hypothetical_protein n=1 Tax=Hexamita inflata TaxID=28002 RepID=A0AA86P6J9_9EUKA|nr:Hypothetical protein HINF_LOCUS20494 [Hexamita inflata]